MNISETIKNIKENCDNYIDPNLCAFIIDDDNHMMTNNIAEVTGYGIIHEDSFEERLIKIHKNENIYLALGMITFMPILNECDIFSDDDYNLKLSQEEFEKYSDSKEKLFGILIKKDSDEYLIGKSDTCSCSVDSCFEEFEKRDCEFYNKIEEIVNKKII